MTADALAKLDRAVLMLWQRPEGPPTLREAAKALGIHRASVHRALLRLEKAKLMEMHAGTHRGWRAVESGGNCIAGAPPLSTGQVRH